MSKRPSQHDEQVRSRDMFFMACPLSLSFGNALTGADANKFTPKEVNALITQADCTEAGVVLVPDTAINTLDSLTELEESSGKPLLTANQVTLWDVLRLADLKKPLPKLGTLMRKLEINLPLCLE